MAGTKFKPHKGILKRVRVTAKGKVTRKFLEEGHKVLVTLIFRGREQKRPELGFNLLKKFSEELSEVAKLEKEPSREAGNRIGMVLVSNKK